MTRLMVDRDKNQVETLTPQMLRLKIKRTKLRLGNQL